MAALVIVVAAAVIISHAADPFLRARIERAMNKSLKGYHTSLGGAHLEIIGGALSLANLTVVQNAHPAPPVGHLPLLRISIQWRELLGWHIVADCLIDHPEVHLNLIQLSAEHSGKVPLRQRGWQDALQSIYPFKINQFRIRDGNITYIDTDSTHPLQLEHVNFTADNIRNIHSPANLYPSSITATAAVFDTGRASIDGRANFLSKPIPGVLVNYQLDHVPLAALEPAIRRVNLTITGGSLDSDGIVEYSATVRRVDVRHAAIDHVNVEYIHQSATAQAETRRVEAIKRAAQEANNAPNLLLIVRQAQLTNGTVAYRDDARNPSYRLFISSLATSLSNISNQSSQGSSALALQGMFMASGKTELTGAFRPRQASPDFDLNLAIENTDLVSLNNLLRSYGRFDVQSGQFSLYSQLTVRDNQVQGYVKPLFTNVQVYDYQKDKQKPMLHQAYELAVGGAAKLLKNHSTKAVATEVNLSGKLQNPNVSTFQAILQLVENAFIDAILPGFDRQEKATANPSS